MCCCWWWLLSCHCSGISLGVQRDATNTFLMMAAFTSHKWVISGTVGLNWARSAVSRATYSLQEPIKSLIPAEPPGGAPLHDGLLCHFPHWHRSGAGAQGRVGTGNFCILPGKIFWYLHDNFRRPGVRPSSYSKALQQAASSMSSSSRSWRRSGWRRLTGSPRPSPCASATLCWSSSPCSSPRWDRLWSAK